MKTNINNPKRKRGYTIIELLTVMSIIVILIGLLVPALNKVRIYAKKVRQNAQFHSIGVALDLFNADFGEYPDSGAFDNSATPVPYCGAMKLGEAMVGQDLLGFHPDSRFRFDGRDGEGTDPSARDLYVPATEMDRKGALLPLDNANAYTMGNLWTPSELTAGGFTASAENRYVLCDVYENQINLSGVVGSKSKIGMPILYYKANSTASSHNELDPDNIDNIYNYRDNHMLVGLGVPQRGTVHPLFKDVAEGDVFYRITKNMKIAVPSGRPYRSDSYILLSAGFDGLYGTRDDIFNFVK